MRAKSTMLAFACVLAASASAFAGLVSEFTGFNYVNEVGTSGLRSSYHADATSNQAISGGTISSSIHTLGPSRVLYPSGVGSVPSPGGSLGANFDLGALGIRVNGNSVTVKVASAHDPLTGYTHNGTHYGLGDMFVSVKDGLGVRQFALLSPWARNSGGTPRTIGGGSHFNSAQSFHTSGGAGGTSLEGHLVRLTNNGHVTMTGGTGGYSTSSAPNGLDTRAFARGGTNLGDANLLNWSIVDAGNTWYLQQWTFDLSSITAQAGAVLGLHTTYSCGNDQIALVQPIPAPESTLLGTLGVGLLAAFRRRG